MPGFPPSQRLGIDLGPQRWAQPGLGMREKRSLCAITGPGAPGVPRVDHSWVLRNCTLSSDRRWGAGLRGNPIVGPTVVLSRNAT